MTVFTPRAAEIPPSLDVDTILVDLSIDHVSVPTGKDPAPLEAIVADARAHGIPLSIVLVQGNNGREADLRDLATAIGKQDHGTILALSDDWAGTYSEQFSRARLERAEDFAKNRHGGHSVEAAQAFVNTIEKPEMVSPTAITIVLLVGMVASIGGLYFVKRRRSDSLMLKHSLDYSPKT